MQQADEIIINCLRDWVESTCEKEKANDRMVYVVNRRTGETLFQACIKKYKQAYFDQEPRIRIKPQQD